MPFFRIVLALAMAPLLGACAAISGGCRAGDQPCPGYGPFNGEIDNGTSCAVFVQNRHVCRYDEEGRFKGSDIRPDGVCICLSLGAANNKTEVACAQSPSVSLSERL